MNNEKVVEIHFEVCQNCEKHSWCTHHDEKRYNTLYQEIAQQLEANIPDVKCFKNHSKSVPDIGAFELTTKTGIIIYSKKFTGLFPNPVALVERVKRFIEDMNNGGDTSKYAKMPEKKYEPPRKPKEKMTFQTFMKMKEEEEKKKKISSEQMQHEGEENHEDGQPTQENQEQEQEHGQEEQSPNLNDGQDDGQGGGDEEQ